MTGSDRLDGPSPAEPVGQQERGWRIALASLSALFAVGLWMAFRLLGSRELWSPTERIGVGVTLKVGPVTDYDVSSLHIGWYCDWFTNVTPAHPGGAEYAQLIEVSDGACSITADKIKMLVAANPGSLWIVGNEPECVWQGNNTPEQYAEVYHQVYAAIKTMDSRAQVAIGGVVEPTPLRLQWLDQVMYLYQNRYGQAMPVDVWNTHNHILPEQRDSWGCDIPRGLAETSGRLYTMEDHDSIDVFAQHVVDLRTWMAERGQGDKPLIITEMGITLPDEYGFTPQRISAFLSAAFDYLLGARDEELGWASDGYRLVQRWLWFSLNAAPWDPETGEGYNGALFDCRYRGEQAILTPVGVSFRAYMEDLWIAEVGTARTSGSKRDRTLRQ